MNRVRLGALAAFLAAGGALALVVVAGARRSGYSHASQYISELAEYGSADGRWVSWLGFFPIGLLAAAAALLVQPKLRPSRLLAIGVAAVGLATFIGYGGSAVWRCDTGCPETGGSTAQDMHLFVSVVDWLGVMTGFVCTALALRTRRPRPALFWLSVVGAIAIGGFGPFIGADGLRDVRGLVQRFIELVTFAWFVALGLWVQRRTLPEQDK